MLIGNIDLGKKPVCLAPMEDVTDIAFRLMCKEFGADLVYTEFVSADALIRDVPSTLRKLKVDDRERPVAIQIYGREADTMAEAARIVESVKPDIIDLNFGCPVKKVAGKGAGAGMLRDIPKLLDITRAVVSAVSLPVTVKTRLGWDSNSLVITTLAEQLQDCGISALTIHGRTRAQMYTGEADWALVGEVCNNPRIRIPIIGNGDIRSGEQAVNAFRDYGVSGIMVGRATFGCPWIFQEIKQSLRGEEVYKQTFTENLAVLRRLITESINKQRDNDDGRSSEYQLERRGIIHVRRHLAASPIFKGIRDFRQTRIRMLRAETANELQDILNEISRMQENRGFYSADEEISA